MERLNYKLFNLPKHVFILFLKINVEAQFGQDAFYSPTQN